MQNNNVEVVYLPSALFPGKKFRTITSPKIRQRGLERWRKTEKKYRDDKAKESFESNAVKEALESAQAASLINRSVEQHVS